MKDFFINYPEETARLLHLSMLRVDLMENNGLHYRGRMGIIILFYHYAKFSGNKLYVDFADDLVEKLCNKLATDKNINFRDGLSGTAWGLFCLYKDHFIDIHEENFFDPIDKVIMTYNPFRMEDLSFDTGFAGILFYINSRLLSAQKGKQAYPFDEEYMQDIYRFIQTYQGDEREIQEQILRFQAIFSDHKETEIDENGILNKIIKEYLLPSITG